MRSIGWERHPRVSRPAGDPVVEELVRQVAVTIDELSAYRELSDGDGWLNADAALSDLHRAMIALQLLDQGEVRPVA